MPFVLLCAITRSREQGTTAIEAAKVTGQDPRSIFQRIITLSEMELIKKFPVVANGAKTTFLVSSRFTTNSVESQHSAVFTERQIDHDKLKQDIISQLKSARNGLRQRSDLKRQLVNFFIGEGCDHALIV